MEQIVEAAKDSALSDAFMEKVAVPVNYIAEKQQLTPIQAVLWSLIVNFCQRDCSVNLLIDYVGSSNLRFFRYMKDIEHLLTRRLAYIKESSYDMGLLIYKVSNRVLDAINDDQDFQIIYPRNLKPMEFIKHFDELCTALRDDEITHNMFVSDFCHLVNDNSHLSITKTLKTMHIDDPMEQILTCACCDQLILKSNDGFPTRVLSLFLSGSRELRHIMTELNNGWYSLFKLKVIEHGYADGFIDRTSIRLTDKAFKRLLKDYKYKRSKEKLNNNLLFPEKITEKQLFYTQNVARQIENLTNLLQEDNYRRICQRMKEHGFRSGFTIFLYGAAGTGKTESVLQIARKTGRGVMMVDISKAKSAYVGESEKLIKEIFDNYKAMVETSKLAPILLFNESDSIINKRTEIGGRNSSVEKMENAIQDIILNEIETLQGIMICTSNFVGSLDSAYDRRFLYKIKFEKPDVQARKCIWHSMIPELSEQDIDLLASTYPFSGGQIENQARKYYTDTILYGEEKMNIERLKYFCDNEQLNKKERTRIGF